VGFATKPTLEEKRWVLIKRNLAENFIYYRFIGGKKENNL